MIETEKIGKIDRDNVKPVLEGILFIAGEPVSIDLLCKGLHCDINIIENALRELGDEYNYNQRGIRIIRLENSWQMVTAQEHSEIIRNILETRKPAKLSPALLEVVTIIAYFQPTTRAYVEQMRGVSSKYSINALIERGLVEECGKLEVAGRPTLYRTTKLFLKTFGIASIDELPPLPEVGDVQQ